MTKQTTTTTTEPRYEVVYSHTDGRPDSAICEPTTLFDALAKAAKSVKRHKRHRWTVTASQRLKYTLDGPCGEGCTIAVVRAEPTEPRYEVVATYSNGIASAILDAPTTRDDAIAKARKTVGFMTGHGWTLVWTLEATIGELRYVLDGPRYGCTIDVVRVYTTTAGDETIRHDCSDVTAFAPNYDGDGTARPVITLAKGVNMSAAVAIDRLTATDNDAVTSSERAALAVVVGSINAGDARIDAAGRVSIGAATIGRVIATHDEPTEPPPTEPKNCAHCGSTLGLDCGDAERDYDGDHCSHGCYALATDDSIATDDSVRV